LLADLKGVLTKKRGRNAHLVDVLVQLGVEDGLREQHDRLLWRLERAGEADAGHGEEEAAALRSAARASRRRSPPAAVLSSGGDALLRRRRCRS
jgi:hypothetical protein